MTNVTTPAANVSTPAVSAASFDPINPAGMDLETVLLMVQNQRAALMDQQLHNQIREVEQRNELTAQLNNLQNKLSAMKEEFSSDAKPTDQLPNSEANRKLCVDYASLCKSLKISTAPVVVSTDGKAVTSLPQKKDIETTITNIKSKIDANSNTQQMDMIRLQSLSNKRNEAYELMTNAVKKMQDGRNAIISNMR